jgi:hypothetical protein
MRQHGGVRWASETKQLLDISHAELDEYRSASHKLNLYPTLMFTSQGVLFAPTFIASCTSVWFVILLKYV